MMADDPYAPQSLEPQPDLNDPALQEAAPEPDLSDPSLTTESLETDANADSYAIPPPLPDGKWRAKLQLVDINKQGGGKSDHPWILVVATWSDKVNGKHPQFFAFNIQATVLDLTNHYDGTKLTEYWNKTEVDKRRGGASPASTVIRRSGGIVPEGSPQMIVRDIMVKHMAGEPEVIIETEWEARCQACEERADKAGTKKPRAVRQGMRNFPPAQNQKQFVKFDPVVKCGTCESTVRAQPRIKQYFATNATNPTYTPQNTPVRQ